MASKDKKGGPRRILLITPRFPFPVIGGDKLRVYNIARYLSRFFRIDLASLYSTREEIEAAPEAGIFGEVLRVRQPRALSYCYTAGAFLNGGSLQSGYFYNPRLKRLVDARVRDYDLVLAHLFRVSDYVDTKGVPSICELTDAISMNYERVSMGALSVKGLIYSFERKRCLEAEKRCIESFSGSVVVSKADKDYLAQRCPEHTGKMHVIPNGVRLDPFKRRETDAARGKIVFIGNMRSMQNSDAAVYFAREVFPLIRRWRDDATFWIVGADPGRAVRALSSAPGVVVTGRVDDVGACVKDAAVSVCPVRIGAGIQNKVLESMAMGLPVVTTPVGAEGLDAEDGRHLLVANGAPEFAGRVLELLNDAEKGRALAHRGRRLVEDGYSWEGMLGAYRALVERVIDGAKGTAGR